jgi:ABC-type transport system substrate-binding protein
LPNNLSPLSARSPVERQAASLMFESLVRWAGDHYEPQLAEGRPLPLARGRQFFLPAGAVWSDSPEGAPYYCTAEDVIWTLKLFDRLHPPGYSRSWAALFDVPKDAPRDGESFSVALKVVRDHWAPLSLMDFPILPSHRFPKLGSDPAEIAAFNAQPTGSGPYVFRERTTDPEKVVFAANPHYRRLGLPRIREVAFNRADFVGESGSVKMLLQGRLHLIYDVPSSVLQELEGAAGASLCRVHKLRRPEVCFLAPNYRRPKMQNASLRLAIAHAIHRKQILDQYFRGTRPGDHAELTGPYPRDSWAYDAEVPPFDPALASVHLAKARQELSLDGEVSLSLACPGRDPDIAQACTQIANALAPLGIKLTVQAVEPDQFHEMIYQRFPFDLVYWRHEFPNETYWLWPLVDPNEIGPQGANFMAYRPQPDLLGMFNHLKTHKAFAEIRATTHDIHAYFARHAVVIPLWQLDTYVAVHRLVRIPSGTLDPMAPLSGIEHWTLSSK